MAPVGLRLLLSSGVSTWFAAVLALLALYLVARAYDRRVRGRLGWRWLLPMGARALGALAIWLLLARPEVEFLRDHHHEREVLILLDASGSMSVTDVESEPSRLRQAALAALDAERHLRAPGLRAAIRPFREDPAAPVAPEDLLQLQAHGDTRLAPAFLEAAKGASPPLRVLLLGDGRDTSGADPVPAATALGAPIDTVRVGRAQAAGARPRDVAIAGVEHRDQAPIGSVLPITVHVEAEGYAGKTATVELLEGETVLAKREVLLGGAAPVTATLHYHPEAVGLHELALRIPPLPGEAIGENNRLALPFAIHERLPRVLYLEGELRPSYKFLRRALATDPGLEFMSFVMLADGEFLRQGSIHGLALDRPPEAPSQWSAVDVLILGSVGRAEIGDAMLESIRARVRAGMGLLLLSGTHATGAQAAHGGGPLGPVLPLRPSGESQTAAAPYVVTVARPRHALGEALAPLVRPEPKLELGGVDGVRALGPGATVVLGARSAAGDGEALPLLVTQRYGGGKVAVFLGQDAWRWSGIGRPQAQQRFLQFWGRTLRWLADPEDQHADAGPEFSVRANRLILRVGEELTLSARWRGGEEGGAAETGTMDDPGAVVAADSTAPRIVGTVVDPESTDVAPFGFAPVPAMAGLYEARFRPTAPGRLRLRIEARAGDTVLAKEEIVARVRGGPGEFEQLSPNRALLERIAKASGGQTVALNDLAAHARALVETLQAERTYARLPLWSAWPLFLAATGFLSLEWALRKRFGLP